MVDGQIMLTEATVLEAIRQVAFVLGALITAGFGAIGVMAHRSQRSAAAAHAELVPNHGSSQRDAVNRMERKLDAFALTQRQLVENDAAMERRLDSHIEQSERILGALITKETA